MSTKKIIFKDKQGNQILPYSRSEIIQHKDSNVYAYIESNVERISYLEASTNDLTTYLNSYNKTLSDRISQLSKNIPGNSWASIPDSKLGYFATGISFVNGVINITDIERPDAKYTYFYSEDLPGANTVEDAINKLQTSIKDFEVVTTTADTALKIANQVKTVIGEDVFDEDGNFISNNDSSSIIYNASSVQDEINKLSESITNIINSDLTGEIGKDAQIDLDIVDFK